MKNNNNKEYPSKNYIHFDGKRVYNENTENYVTNPEIIKSHSFYPLIRYNHRVEKFKHAVDGDSRPIEKKERKIMYASHIDNFIYKHYSEILNKHYNQWAREHSIDQNAIAYRSKEGEKGKSNIEHAADVINQIYEMESCYIIIGDFENYFDKLDHKKLKNRLCRVMQFDNNYLPKDWFNVFKSITKYSYYNQKLLHKYCGTERQLKKNNQFKYFSSPEAFRTFKSLYPISYNSNSYGIPQGTAISAILSNVYAIDLDSQINQLIHDYEGVYRRYSDDFIIVLPLENTDVQQFEMLKDNIFETIKENGIGIKNKKTETYWYQNGRITYFDDSTPTSIDYLGFVFDGERVEMRGKSPAKFYRHARRLIAKAKKVKKEKNLKKLPYRKQIYNLYTDLGMARRPFGNFLTYACRSQKKFDKISPNTKNNMMRQVNNRRKKIEKMLGYRITHKLKTDHQAL